MSSLASHFTPNTPSSVTSRASPSNELADGAVQYTKDLASGLIPSTQGGPSVWRIPEWIAKEYEMQSTQRRKRKRTRTLTIEDDYLRSEVAARFASRLAVDHISVLHPDVDTPFVDDVDVVQRLLPYHVFQLPHEDIATGSRLKGKCKASSHNSLEDIKETQFALHCFRRRDNLRARLKRVRLRIGKRDAPDVQSYTLAQIAVEADRAEVASLNAELRNARLALDKIQREKFGNSRQPFYTTTAPSTPYYRNYQYAYAQPYGTTLQAGHSPQATTAQPPSTPATMSTTTNGTIAPTSAIPVQLPVGSLPALHALGIVPVPIASLPPSDQTQPPAVLRGTTANGTMLSLEINVSLLQQAQMSGLAMVLNSLMSRGGAATDSPAVTAPVSTASGTAKAS